MDWLPLLTATAAGGLMTGLGLKLGQRVIPLLSQSYADTRTVSPSRLGTTESAFDGLRSSSIIGLYDAAIRHTDGSYTKGFRTTLQPTAFMDDQLAEGRCDMIARMLATPKPAGTVVSLRLSVDTDPGFLPARHKQHLALVDGINPNAKAFHECGNDFLLSLAKLDFFKRQDLTCWVRVPSKHANDGIHQGWTAYFNGMWDGLQTGGISTFWRNLTTTDLISDDGIVRRLQQDENEAFTEASKVFRLVERSSPLSLHPMSAPETFANLCWGHNFGTSIVPQIDFSAFLDLRPYLCAESIQFAGSYVLHGNCPVARVSLLVPPQPFIDAKLLRPFVFSPDLNFRHTFVGEFVTLDKDRSKSKIARRKWRLKRANTKLNGQVSFDADSDRAYKELTAVEDALTNSGEAMTAMRVYALVFGPMVRTQSDLKPALKVLEDRCEQMEEAMGRMTGAFASREEPAGLQFLYERSLVAECDGRSTKREIEETCTSLAPLVVAETAWKGAGAQGHSIFSTKSAHLFGLDLFDYGTTGSPVVLILARPRAGKSVLAAKMVSDVLGTSPGSRALGIDFGESLGPTVDTLGGRHIRYSPSENLTINAFDYKGLEVGIDPDEEQIGLVVDDAMRLARVTDDQAAQEDILDLLVRRVYKNEVPRNLIRRETPEIPKREPRLSHLLELLDSYDSDSPELVGIARKLFLRLSKYRGHPIVDAPTSLGEESFFDVFELDSLYAFSNKDIRACLAYRTAARVLRARAPLKPDGTRAKTVIMVDEAWRIKNDFPEIYGAIRRATRQGPKDNVATIFCSQAYEDFEGLHDILKTAGVKIIGSQVSDFSLLARDIELSPAAQAEIKDIQVVPGLYAEFLIAVGTGQDRIVQTVRNYNDPFQFWTFANNPPERNARGMVQTLFGVNREQANRWLAQHYPQGLGNLNPDHLEKQIRQHMGA